MAPHLQVSCFISAIWILTDEISRHCVLLGSKRVRLAVEQTAILATALTAAISAFAILIPGQTENYFLPLIPLAVWLASLGQGCASAGFGSGFLKLLGWLPIYPMFGHGLTR